ncbi:hypothetical protein [Phycicoccus avicenniae]|uniref:hypothetical protein n=1 Tax=Phycicoccus avicenniae TaxID=2828860 RepID=UPI003D27E48A
MEEQSERDAAGPEAVEAVAVADDAEHPDPATTDLSAGAPEGETRAQRRARREALLRNPVLPEMATVVRPVVVVATVVLAALLVLALRTDPLVLAAGLAWTGLVLAWGWPRLLGSSSRFGSALAVGVTAVLAPAAAVAPTDEPYLRLVPVALAVGLGLMFGHQIVRRDGRPRLTDSIGVTSFGLALLALGTTWLPLSRESRPTDLATAALVAVAVGALADLGAGVKLLRPWLLPVAMVLGACGAIVTGALLDSPRAATAALVGLLAAAVSHAMRRVLVVLPPVTAIRCQLASAAAGLLVPGVVAYGVSLALVG